MEMFNNSEFISKLYTKRTYSSKNKYISITLGRALKIRSSADKDKMVQYFWEYQYQNINENNLNCFTTYVHDPIYRVLYCDWYDHNNNNELSEILYDWEIK